MRESTPTSVDILFSYLIYRGPQCVRERPFYDGIKNFSVMSPASPRRSPLSITKVGYIVALSPKSDIERREPKFPEYSSRPELKFLIEFIFLSFPEFRQTLDVLVFVDPIYLV
jgi:hypothetical protein